MWRGMWVQGTVVLCMVGLCLVVSRWAHVGRYQPSASGVSESVAPKCVATEDGIGWVPLRCGNYDGLVSSWWAAGR